MSESLGGAIRPGTQRKKKHKDEPGKLSKAELILLYEQRAAKRQCIFTGKPHGEAPEEDDDEKVSLTEEILLGDR